MARQIFYSFHFKNDVMRVQQIRNIWTIEGNKPVQPNKWEEVKSGWDSAIRRWIDEKIKYASCIVVLIGSETNSSKWVKYEIEQAWKSWKGLVGINIHNLKDPRYWISTKWVNPFDWFNIDWKKLSTLVKTYNPSWSAYDWISQYIDYVVEEAIKIRNKY